MIIKQIISKRYFTNWVSWDLVFEWEEIFQEHLDAKFFNDRQLPIVGGIVRRFPVLSKFLPLYTNSFSFELGPWKDVVGRNKSNIVPCIIDFYLKDNNDLERFYAEYNKHKVVLVSSAEVKSYLDSVNCPINIQHLGLSLSDKYRITKETFFEKKYDVVLIGRTNVVLENFLDCYKKKYDISIIKSKKVGDDYICYTDKEQYVCKVNDRAAYLGILQKARCTLYATPGIDGGEKRTNGFNQVTPRFLEALACGCHVITRYESNPDTCFYELEKYWKNVTTYDEFEKEMNKALTTEFDVQFASMYLSQHYTSTRVKQLVDIVTGI